METPIEQLQNSNINKPEGDNLVNEILGEIESQQNQYEKEGIQENNEEIQQTVATEIQPSKNELMQMQQEQIMQQQILNNNQLNNQNNLSIEPAKLEEKKSLTDLILSQAKSPLLVSIIYFLLSMDLMKPLLSKIPNAINELGNITTIGLIVKSLIAGVIFYISNKFI